MRQSKAFQLFVGIALATVGLVGCGVEDRAMGIETRTAAASMAGRTGFQATTAVQLAGTLTPVTSQPRKIIYRAQASLDCENLDQASQKLLGKVKALGGYVGDADSSGTRGTAREATWTVRVPATSYESLLKALPGIGELESSSQKAEDVSEEFYDAQARIRNKSVEEARLIELLKNHSGKLTDILVLEKELSRVREEIERIEGRIRYLANQTQLSTITITLREVKNFVPQGSPSLKTRAARAFGGSIETMKVLGASALVIAVSAAPWLIPLIVIVWALWRLVNRKLRPVRRIVIPERP